MMTYILLYFRVILIGMKKNNYYISLVYCFLPNNNKRRII